MIPSLLNDPPSNQAPLRPNKPPLSQSGLGPYMERMTIKKAHSEEAEEEVQSNIKQKKVPKEEGIKKSLQHREKKLE